MNEIKIVQNLWIFNYFVLKFSEHYKLIFPKLFERKLKEEIAPAQSNRKWSENKAVSIHELQNIRSRVVKLSIFHSVASARM